MTIAEACTLLADQTLQTAAARAERDELRCWLRAALRCLIDHTRELNRRRELLRREQQQHRDLRERILERQEAA